MKAVLDTNVVVSALISPMAAPARIVDAWKAGRFVWVVSRPLVEELQRVLEYPKIRKRNVAASTQQLLVRLIEGADVDFVSPTETIAIISTDPSDNRLLEAAVIGDAAYIVTGDEALLALGQFRGVQMIRPALFVAVLDLEAG